MCNLLILTEAGQDIGFGHLTRCTAIMDDYMARGFSCCMLVYFAGESGRLSGNYRIFNWHEEEIEEGILGAFDKLLVDSYLVNYDKLKALSAQFSFTAVLDDYNRMTYPVDLIINPNVYFNKESYQNQSAKVVGGRSYTILRKAFRNLTEKTNSVEPGKKRILVTLGGSDVHGLSPKIARLMLAQGFTVRVIAPEVHIQNQVRESAPDAVLLEALDQWKMREEYTNADLVISACGQTLHELAATGCTTIAIVIGQDQLGNQKFYFSSGFLWFDFHHENPEYLEKLNEAVKVMLQPEIRKYIGSLAPFLPERNGVTRYFELFNS